VTSGHYQLTGITSLPTVLLGKLEHVTTVRVFSTLARVSTTLAKNASLRIAGDAVRKLALNVPGTGDGSTPSRQDFGSDLD
jgi:hypothetical protein